MWTESSRKLSPLQNRAGFIFRPRNASITTATLDGGTDAILSANSSKAYQIFWVGYSNAGDATRTVSMKWGSGSEFLKFAVESGGNLLMNFIGAEFRGDENTALNGVLDDAGTVYVTVCYAEVEA